MKILHLPEQLKRFADGKSEIHFEGETFNDMGRFLEAHHSGIYQQLFNSHNQLKPFARLFINRLQIHGLNDIIFGVNDHLSIIIATAGG